MSRVMIVMVLAAVVARAGLETCRIPVLRSGDQAPVVDGMMQGSEWQYALALTGLISLEGPLAQRQATVYYVSDGTWLYAGMYAPAVPPGTAPEVKAGPAYTGKVYTDFVNNDRVEVKFSPPHADTAGDVYVVADAAGHRLVEHIGGEHRVVFPEFDYESSYDGQGWTVEMRLPLSLFGRDAVTGPEPWRVNFTVVRLFPLKYEGLVCRPHSLGEAILTPDAPALQLERLGDLPRGKLDLALSIREYEGHVATPKEGAYDERKIESGGLKLAATGKVARVSWELAGPGAEPLTGSDVLDLHPARPVTAGVVRDFTPAAQNTFRLRVETAANRAALAAGETVVLYAAELPFVPFVQAEADQWQERLTRGTVPGSWRFNVGYFPYWEKAKVQTVFFAGRVADQAARLRVTIASDQGFHAATEVPVVDGRMAADTADGLLDIPIPGLPAGTYTARGEVLDAAGGLVASEERTWVRRVFPWEHNDLGKSRGVIQPWTPMAVDGDTVVCWGRRYELTPAGLPARIVSQGKDVLAGPVTLDGLEATGPLRFIEIAEDRIRWEGRGRLGDLDVTVAGLAEYDGFSWYELTLSPRQPTRLTALRLTVPLSEAQGQLMHFQSCWARNNFSGAIPSGEGTVFRSLDTTNYGKTGGFSPHVWLGNPTRGLSWFADSDEGWSSSAAVAAQEVVRAGDEVRLVLNVIARPVTVDRPRTIRFGLMATPVKPLLPIRDIPTRAVNWLSFKDGRTVVQAHMYATYPPNFDYGLIDEHVLGRRLYFNKHELGAALPERAVFDNEWGGMEPSPDYPGSVKRFGPGIESRVVGRALTASRIDMMVWYIAELARRTRMGGTYWDITGISRGLPMLENGTAYVDPETGDLEWTYDIRRSRELFKRVATVWQEIRGEPDYMEIHSTNHIGVPFYSFAYVLLNFEWLWPNPKALRPDGRWQDFIDLRPLDLFAAEGVPGQFGFWINSINGGKRPDDPADRRRIERSATALRLLHNHFAGGMGGSGLVPPPTIGRRDEVDFVGYWADEDAATTDHELVRAGYWRSETQRELAVVNLDLEPRRVTVRLPLPWPGTVTETTDDATLAEVPETRFAGDHLELTLTIPSHDYRTFVVGRKQ